MNLDFEGKAYAEASMLQRQWGQSLLHETDLRGDEVILDLGCGDGVLTSAWADRVPDGRVVGIDSSPGMLDYATSANSRPNIEYRIGDLEDFHSEPAPYDLIISNAALHWVQGHERLLPRLYELLRPGGRVRLSFGAKGNCSTFFIVAREAMRLPSFADSFKDFNWPWRNETVERYRQILTETPFSDFQVWGQIADATFSHSEEVIAWMEQPLLVPFLNHLPPSLRSSFHDTVVDNMLAVSRNSDGAYFEYFRKVNVLAFRDYRNSHT